MKDEDLHALPIHQAALELAVSRNRTDQPRLAELFPEATDAELAAAWDRANEFNRAAARWGAASMDAFFAKQSGAGIAASNRAEFLRDWPDFSETNYAHATSLAEYLNR